MEYGLQLYSVRDAMEKDVAQTLRAIAKMGYASVEFAGFFGKSAQDIADLLKETGLRVAGTHTTLQSFKENYNEALAYHKAIGNEYIVIPGADLSTREALDAFIRDVRFFQPRLLKDGVRLCYHNHDFEYRVSAYGVMPIRALEEETDLNFETDIYWAYAAGASPTEEMKRFGKRLASIHLKDGLPGGEGKPLGQGTAPVAQALAFAREIGVPVIVESETLDPDGLTEARVCMEYLQVQE